jgi:hypothetical protein
LVQDSLRKSVSFKIHEEVISDEIYSSLYELRDDSLFLLEFLAEKNGNPRFYADSLFFDFSKPMFMSASGDFHLQLCNEWKKEVNQIRNPKNEHATFRFERDDEILHLKEGVPVYEIVSQKCKNTYFKNYGRLEIRDYYWEWGVEHDSIIIENKSEPCKSFSFPYADFSFAELPVGIYKIHLKNSDGETALTIYNIEIKEDQITELDYYYGYNGGGVSFKDYPSYSSENSFLAFDINLMYGHKDWSRKNGSDLFSLGFSEEMFFLPGKKQSVFYMGPQFGLNYSFYNIQKDLISSGFKHRYYSYLSFDLGFTARLYFSNRAQEYKPHPLIQLGAYYKLPLYFRDYQRNGNVKEVKSQIHNFNDVILFVKLGASQAVSFIAEYRVFNIVNTYRPPLPKLKFGISILIDTDM